MRSLWNEACFWGTVLWIMFLRGIKLVNLAAGMAVVPPLASFYMASNIEGVRVLTVVMAHFFIDVEEGIIAHFEMLDKPH